MIATNDVLALAIYSYNIFEENVSMWSDICRSKWLNGVSRILIKRLSILDNDIAYWYVGSSTHDS